MKVLITGAAGFIGSALAQRLMERGDTGAITTCSASSAIPCREQRRETCRQGIAGLQWSVVRGSWIVVIIEGWALPTSGLWCAVRILRVLGFALLTANLHVTVRGR